MGRPVLDWPRLSLWLDFDETDYPPDENLTNMRHRVEVLVALKTELATALRLVEMAYDNVAMKQYRLEVAADQEEK